MLCKKQFKIYFGSKKDFCKQNNNSNFLFYNDSINDESFMIKF